MRMVYTTVVAGAAVLMGCAHSRETKVDLSTPESTIAGFTKAAARSDAALAQSYFLPGGVDYQDILDTLTAKPGTPRYAARVMMESVDTTKPVKLKVQEQIEQGLKAVWEVTFHSGFKVDGRRVEAGTTYDFDATLTKTDKGWLIDNFYGEGEEVLR